ncbi:BatD family protein [Sorangium sp. So ce1389]|uniref:BatD family protein n=1 Tax=Sorangium sp. So ce1389 TaxID=3133336 RepID=UPI003F624109
MTRPPRSPAPPAARFPAALVLSPRFPAALALSPRFPAALAFPRRPAPLATALLLALLALLAPLRARAQQPELSSGASSTEVEVGEPFSVEVKALVERGAGMPSDPELRVPPDLDIVSGPSIGTQMKTQMGGGVVTTQLGISATWQVVANKPGRYTIPGPTITWNGRRLPAAPILIKVVPASGRPRRPNNPFLLPGGPLHGFPWPFSGPGGLLDEEDAEDEPEDQAPELAMPNEPDPVVFLRAIPDKTAAVVGEQVTVSFYLYFRENAEMSEPRAAPSADFLRYQLLEDARQERPVYTRVGGHRYAARLVDKLALFPLKAGELHTGSMQARITGRRIGARVLRESNDIVVRVTEPPLAGRPSGYALGDVGQFTLKATVQPREIDQGGSVAVNVQVTGTGNFPQSLRVPERTGLEWLDPEKRESLEPRAGAIGGFRSFGYVVRIQESGAVNLGKIEFPYWDPAQKRYVVETADLGVVQARAVAPPAPSGPAPGAPDADRGAAGRAEPFAGMPGLRTSLGQYTPPATLPLDGAPFWLLLAAPPLVVTLFGAGDRLMRRARERRAAGATSPARLAALALREAEEAAAQGDLKATAAAIERALHRAIESATGLRSRGVLLAALPGELGQRGVPEALSARACEALAACEAIRFEPAEQEGGGAAAAALVEKSRAVMTELTRWKPT